MYSRAVSRAARAAAPSLRASRATKVAVPFMRMKSDVVRETEVPVSVYAPDAKGAASSTSDHFSIPVPRDSVKPQPISEDPTDVVPLTQKVFSTLPPTMQKMSIMDKVVVVTG